MKIYNNSSNRVVSTKGSNKSIISGILFLVSGILYSVETIYSFVQGHVLFYDFIETVITALAFIIVAVFVFIGNARFIGFSFIPLAVIHLWNGFIKVCFPSPCLLSIFGPEWLDQLLPFACFVSYSLLCVAFLRIGKYKKSTTNFILNTSLMLILINNLYSVIIPIVVIIKYFDFYILVYYIVYIVEFLAVMFISIWFNKCSIVSTQQYANYFSKETELLLLKKWLDNNLITVEEYEAKKQQLL